MDVALRYLGYQARTVREVERYLDERQYGEYQVQQVVERLQELNLVNDAAFAEDFVRTRLASKPVSRRHLREQMLKHELEKDAIDTALAAVTDEMEQQNAALVAKKYLEQLAEKEPEERQQRVMQRLAARGFDYAVARRGVELAEAEEEV